MMDRPPMTPQFLTRDEVIRTLRVDPRTVTWLVNSGRLPVVRFGREWRIRRSEFEAWVSREKAIKLE